MSDLISVTVAVYNTEKFLAKCMDAILAQTYKNIEIIAVDDGSKDGSLGILQEYEKKDSRVKAIHQENGGLAAARNTGLEHANGKYVCFLDSDDYIEEDYLEQLYQCLTQNDADVAVCGYYKELPNGRTEDMLLGIEGIVERDEAIANMYMHNSFGAYSWNKLFKMSIVKEYNIRYDLELRMTQDLYWSTLYMKQIKKAAYVNKPLYHYIYNEDSAVHKIKKTGKFNKKFLTSIKAHEKTKEVLKDESEFVRLSFSERYVNTYMRLVVNMYYSHNRDKNLIRLAHKNVRKNIGHFLKSKHYKKSQRLGALLIAVHPRVFMFVYGIMNKLFGLEV